MARPSPPQGGRTCSRCCRGATSAASPSRSRSRTKSRPFLAAPALGEESHAPFSSSTSPTSTSTSSSPAVRSFRGCSRPRGRASSSPVAAAAAPPSPSSTSDPRKSSSTTTKRAKTAGGPSCPNWHPLSTPAAWSGSEDEALDPRSSPEAFAALPPPWKVLLLSDGSVTRHLQILTGSPVAVDLLEMGPIAGSGGGGGSGAANGADDADQYDAVDEESDNGQHNSSSSDLPSGAELLRGPLVQRRVLLRADEGRGEALVYAASWWNAGDAAAALDGVASSGPGSSPSSSSSSSSSPAASSSPSPSRQREQPIWTSLASSRTELFREIRSLYLGGCPALERDLGARPGEALWGRHYLFWSGGKPLTVIYEVFSPRLREWLGGTTTEG